MRQSVLLISPLLLLMVLVVAVAAQVPEKAGLPIAVGKRLDQYLASSFAASDAVVLLVERARRPWEFSESMSHSVLGDSVFFQTDHPLTWKQGSGSAPLPFPPKELWCAFLEESAGAAEERFYTVIYVGLHMDMYSGDWIVHQGPRRPSMAEVGETLSILQCGSEALTSD